MRPNGNTIEGRALCEDGTLCPDTFILDVRTPAEFTEAHIPGSINIPLGDLGSRAAEVSSRAGPKRIALVCRTGRRATSALETLQLDGPMNLQVLEGGLVSWTDAGLPVKRGRKAFSLERQVRIAAGALTLSSVLLGLLAHPAFFGVAGFVGAGLVFAGLTDSCAMGMLLAKMPWNREPGTKKA